MKLQLQLEQIREQQEESWNKFSSGWRKWDDLVMDFLKPVGNEIIRMLDPKGNAVVLDIASGTGEPGLTIASMLKGGKVQLTDVSENMLVIAHENAANRGINNIEISVCDACELPFDDNTFDAISCRFGFMFFPDMLLAAKEMIRVLKPGGRIATSVWNIREKNFWVTVIIDAINRNIDSQAPLPGAPGMFRCSQDGLMLDLFSHVGFNNISQNEIIGKLNCKTFDVFWKFQTEVAAPIVAALNKANNVVRERIKSEVKQAVNQRYPNGHVVFDSSALVIYGEK
jgi:ubiquinone/menaquinone biosynthesis C-methylase UbiE